MDRGSEKTVLDEFARDFAPLLHNEIASKTSDKRDPSHEDQVERWARFVKNNPREVWIKELKPFIDAQIRKANRFYEKLAEEKGEEKAEEITALHADKHT